MAPQDAVWDSLVNPKTIQKWGAGPAKMDVKEGGSFSIWGGDIWGKNINVTPKKELIQEWFTGNWPKPSIVTFRLTHKNGCTTLFLTHKGVPEKEFDSIDEGWDDYYLGEIQKLLEKG